MLFVLCICSAVLPWHMKVLGSTFKVKISFCHANLLSKWTCDERPNTPILSVQICIFVGYLHFPPSAKNKPQDKFKFKHEDCNVYTGIELLRYCHGEVVKLIVSLSRMANWGNNAVIGTDYKSLLDIGYWANYMYCLSRNSWTLSN